MSPGSSTDSYREFAHIGLRENPKKTSTRTLSCVEDRVRNINIRNELQQAPVVEQIERKQLNWFGHLVRMVDERKVKEVFESRGEGKRRRGRPRIEGEQYVNDMVRRRGKEIREIGRLALDRERYKKWVEDPTLQGTRDR
ncbi:hypothetical protein ANN_04337 [Periplaneta americana]|uniref:Uncharacterized protein n=1 Tax=Periplaneta americana TaxID=6978 RepID=A0ABQ8T9H0_PERAM|nr:hypothetical protein ANN_04337 [Periplaneta americana]